MYIFSVLILNEQKYKYTQMLHIQYRTREIVDIIHNIVFYRHNFWPELFPICCNVEGLDSFFLLVLTYHFDAYSTEFLTKIYLLAYRTPLIFVIAILCNRTGEIMTD